MIQKKRQFIIFGTIAFILVISGYSYWVHQQYYPSTDDAYIEAHTINIAAQVNGKIQQVFVKNLQHVTTHQLLFIIDPKPFQIALQQAQAKLSSAKQAVLAEAHAVDAARAQLSQQQAQLIDVQKNYERIMTLTKKGFYSTEGADNATRQLAVSKESVVAAKDQLAEARAKLGKMGDHNPQIQAAMAALSQAKLNLQYTHVYAPAAGQLAQFTLQQGQTVTAYRTLFSLVEDHTWWATANMKETSLSRIRAGQSATVIVDMYPDHIFHGVVKNISPGSGASFSLLPAENASGNWVKVTQRFPVRVEITNTNARYPLRIGASCTVTINTHAS